MLSKKLVGLVLLIALSLVVPLQSARAAGPDNPRDRFLAAESVTIPADQVVSHDLYVGGSNVSVLGRIEGDLFVLGGQVDVSGPVSGDLFVAAGNATISSEVGRSLRIGGGNVTVSGPIGGDLLMGAGTLLVAPGARVGGDLIFGGGRATVEGTVDGSVLGSAEDYQRTGSIAGTEEVKIRPRNEERREQPKSAAQKILDEIRRYLSIILVGGLLLLLVPRLIQPAAARVREQPLPSLGWGIITGLSFFVTLFILLLAMIVLAIIFGVLGFGQLAVASVLGILLAMAGTSYLFVIVLLFVAATVVGLALGRLAFGSRPEPWAQRPWIPLLLGVLVIVVLTAIPIAGGILGLFVFLFGLGGLAIALWPGRRVGPSAAPPTERTSGSVAGLAEAGRTLRQISQRSKGDRGGLRPR